jgi:hypothetical protein
LKLDPQATTLLLMRPLITAPTFRRLLGSAVATISICALFLPAQVPDDPIAHEVFRTATRIPIVSSLVKVSAFPFATAFTYLFAIAVGFSCAVLGCVVAVDHQVWAGYRRTLTPVRRAITVCVCAAVLWLPLTADGVPRMGSRLYSIFTMFAEQRISFAILAVGVSLAYAVLIPWLLSGLAVVLNGGKGGG